MAAKRAETKQGFVSRLFTRRAPTRAESSATTERPALGERFRRPIEIAGHIVTGALALTVLAASVLAHRPLERYVAGLRALPPNIVFEWPTTEGAGAESTWLPAPVRIELMRLAGANLTPDPFDREALVRTRARLEATGWIRQVTTLAREPGGVVRIAGEWRLPAALVKRGRETYLVARGGELLQLPPNAPLKPGSLFTIMNPFAEPPADAPGRPTFGKAWPGGDVQAAVALLEQLHTIPGADQVVGIDLQGYMKTGKLILVTDRGTRIVWGSAVDEVAPGEVKAEVKLARLREFVRTYGRIDAGQRRIEIYSQRPFVDHTAEALETAAADGGA